MFNKIKNNLKLQKNILNNFKIPLLTLAAFVGVAGFYIIHKKEIEYPKKTLRAKSLSLTNQKESMPSQTSLAILSLLTT